MPSADYSQALEASRVIHETGLYTGRFVRPHAPFIKEIIDRLGCRTVLDFGAGKGEQYSWVMPARQMTLEQYWGVEVTKYDPAWPPYAAEPTGTFDLVICTHTLGAIPKADLGWVVDRLYGLATKAIYIAEKIGRGRKQLLADASKMPPGMSPQEWLEVVRRDSPIEVTMSTHEIRAEGRIMTHWRLAGGQWSQHRWPDGLRPFNKDNA